VERLGKGGVDGELNVLPGRLGKGVVLMESLTFFREDLGRLEEGGVEA
jgi:hypothetical protein